MKPVSRKIAAPKSRFPAAARRRVPGNASPRQDRTREALLGAAKKLFASQGYDATSVKELARAARVNVSLVSYHFEGKEGLYRACLEQFGRARLAVAERILQPPETADELRVRLQLFIEEMIVCHLAEPELAQIIHRECEMDLPVIPDIFRDTFLKVFETLKHFLASARKRKLVRGDVEPHLATLFLFGSLLHAFRTEQIGRKYFGFSIADPGFRRKFAGDLLAIFVKGLSV